jgi:hypothetical protein
MKRPAGENLAEALTKAREEYINARTYAQIDYERDCADAWKKFTNAIRPTLKKYHATYAQAQLVIWGEEDL